MQAIVDEVGHGDVAAHEPVPAGEFADLARGCVRFVGYLAHDLLDDVLHCHHADHPPVLVHDDRHRGARALQLRE